MTRYILPLLMIMSVSACSISMRSDMRAEPVYIVYRIKITNREFPPDSYVTAINLFYDSKRLWYARSANTFVLKYRNPEIVLTDKGMRINFGLLPAEYFDSAGEITLFFLPLVKGNINVAGEFLTKEKEYYYGPRHKTIIEQIPGSMVTSSRSFESNVTGATGTTDYQKQYKLDYTDESLKGKHTGIYIPADIPADTAQQYLFKVLSAKKFNEVCRIEFDSGTCYTFTRYLADKKQFIEIRAVFENASSGNTLYLFAYGNTEFGQLFESIDSEYRTYLAEYKYADQ